MPTDKSQASEELQLAVKTADKEQVYICDTSLFTDVCTGRTIDLLSGANWMCTSQAMLLRANGPPWVNTGGTVCLLCGSVFPTWSAVHVLAEGLQLRFPDCRILVEDHRAAQPLRCSAQTLCSELLGVILINTHTENHQLITIINNNS